MERYNILFERKQVGIIYHFASIELLKDNFIYKAKNQFDWQAGYSDTINFPQKHFLSATRDYNLKWAGRSIRIALDGNKISDKYKILSIDVGHDKEKGNSLAEERIFFKGDVLDLKPYIIQIDSKFSRDATGMGKRLQKFEDEFIVNHRVDKWRPVK